jgi:hypothetical protein
MSIVLRNLNEVIRANKFIVAHWQTCVRPDADKVTESEDSFSVAPMMPVITKVINTEMAHPRTQHVTYWMACISQNHFERTPLDTDGNIVESQPETCQRILAFVERLLGAENDCSHLLAHRLLQTSQPIAFFRTHDKFPE